MSTITTLRRLLALSLLLSCPFFANGILEGRSDPESASEYHYYLNHMCYPQYSNGTYRVGMSPNDVIRSLANSPFPCEQELYVRSACTANGTTEFDFLAEQQCLCNGTYFDLVQGCDACYLAHGYQEDTSDEVASARSSLSTAECSPSPPFQPFSNLLSSANSSMSTDTGLTHGDDRFPSQTAVTNYWTSATGAALGSITGSATARLTSWTNYDGNVFTPSSTPTEWASAAIESRMSSQAAASARASGSESQTGQSAGQSASESVSESLSGNAGAVNRGDCVGTIGGLLVAGLAMIGLS